MGAPVLGDQLFDSQLPAPALELLAVPEQRRAGRPVIVGGRRVGQADGAGRGSRGIAGAGAADTLGAV
jgi:hypothetical protein